MGLINGEVGALDLPISSCEKGAFAPSSRQSFLRGSMDLTVPSFYPWSRAYHKSSRPSFRHLLLLPWSSSPITTTPWRSSPMPLSCPTELCVLLPSSIWNLAALTPPHRRCYSLSTSTPWCFIPRLLSFGLPTSLLILPVRVMVKPAGCIRVVVCSVVTPPTVSLWRPTALCWSGPRWPEQASSSQPPSKQSRTLTQPPGLARCGAFGSALPCGWLLAVSWLAVPSRCFLSARSA